MIDNEEHVARVIFEPKMIYKGQLLVQAFELRSQLKESYLSVLRMAVDGWKTDMLEIPSRKNRTVYGYAEMCVREIRNINLHLVDFDVILLLAIKQQLTLLAQKGLHKN